MSEMITVSDSFGDNVSMSCHIDASYFRAAFKSI